MLRSGSRKNLVAAGALGAAMAYASAAHADAWTSGSGTIFSQPGTKVGVGNSAPATQLDVVANTSLRVGLRVNQQQANANIAEFQQAGSSRVVITAGGVLQAQTVTSTSPAGPAISATSTSGNGLFATTSTGNAVVAKSTSTTGAGIALYGLSGNATGQTGITTSGVYGLSSKGFGVYGETTKESTDMAGVYGYTATNGAAGVLGRHVTLDNQAIGVFGEGLAPSGFFEPTKIVAGNGVGVQGQSGSFGGIFKSILDDCHRDGGGSPLRKADGTFDCIGGAGSGAFGDSAQGTGIYGHSRRVTGFQDPNTQAPNYNADVGAYGVKGVADARAGAFAGVYGEVDPNANADGAAIVANAFGSLSTWAGLFFGDIEVNGTGYYQNGAFVASDARLKKDIVSLPYGLREVLQLRPVTYKWKDTGHDDQTKIGVIAQEIQKVLPDVVSTNRKTGMLAVDYTAIVPVTVKAIQEQNATILGQQKLIQNLEERVRALESSKQPLAASTFGGFGLSYLAVGLLPLGMLIARRRQSRRHL